MIKLDVKRETSEVLAIWLQKEKISLVRSNKKMSRLQPNVISVIRTDMLLFLVDLWVISLNFHLFIINF